jgi:Domain of unknown function (DUF2382)
MKAMAIPMRTVVGLFDDRNEAMRAYTALIEEGYAKADLDILTNDHKDDEPKLAHMRKWIRNRMSVSTWKAYEGAERSSPHMWPTARSLALQRSCQATTWSISRSGATELQAVRTDLKLSDPAKNDNVLEVIEEELQVGKESVERGRMRIYSVVSEKQVAQDVRLKDETLRVQRRPVNRSVTANPDL